MAAPEAAPERTEGISLEPGSIGSPPPAVIEPGPPWHPATLTAFRFTFIYFALYVLTTPVFFWAVTSPFGGVRTISDLQPVAAVVSWVGSALLGFEGVDPVETGSGDRPYDWALSFLLLLVAAHATVVWSLLDRGRRSHERLHGWLLLALRFALGATMVTYGLAKIFPIQLGNPTLSALVQPLGHYSPMGLLWTSMGAAPVYRAFAGGAELAAGILLLVPRVHRVGALLALGAAAHVFILNVSYDVPVKLFSLHLVLMSLVLLAPDLRRLMHVLVLERATEPPQRVPLVRGAVAGRILIAGQVVLALWIVGMNGTTSLRLWLDPPSWLEGRNGWSAAPLHGIWEVEVMTVDDEDVPPLLDDPDRWRRFIVDGPGIAAIQSMDDSLERLLLRVDLEHAILELGAAGADGSGSFAVEPFGADRIVLEGEMRGREMRLELRRADLGPFLLVDRPFRWVQATPFSR